MKRRSLIPDSEELFNDDGLEDEMAGGSNLSPIVPVWEMKKRNGSSLPFRTGKSKEKTEKGQKSIWCGRTDFGIIFENQGRPWFLFCGR